MGRPQFGCDCNTHEEGLADILKSDTDLNPKKGFFIEEWFVHTEVYICDEDMNIYYSFNGEPMIPLY